MLTTKTFNPMSEGADHGLSRDRIRRQLESSLARLGVDRVDLYLAHEMDPETPLAETLGALRRARRGGEDPRLRRQQRGRGVARGGARPRPPDWVQNEYSLLERDDEAGVLPLCAREGLGYTPFSPLAGGWLTGKYRRGEPLPHGSRMTMRPEPYLHLQEDRVFDALEAFEATARERGTTPAALAIAWLLAHGQVTAVVVGPRRPEHLEPALEALDLRLSPPERERDRQDLRVSVLVLSERTSGAAADGRVHRGDGRGAAGARARRAAPAAPVGQPPAEGDSLIGLMPAHRGGDRPSGR